MQSLSGGLLRSVTGARPQLTNDDGRVGLVRQGSEVYFTKPTVG
jgi:hypothetical protein